MGRGEGHAQADGVGDEPREVQVEDAHGAAPGDARERAGRRRVLPREGRRGQRVFLADALALGIGKKSVEVLRLSRDGALLQPQPRRKLGAQRLHGSELCAAILELGRARVSNAACDRANDLICLWAAREASIG